MTNPDPVGLRLRVDPRNGEPLGLQLGRQLRLALATGRLRPGDRLPAAREMAAELGVNFHTVRNAYGDLEREGLLSCEQGRGTFVSAAPRMDPARLRALVAEHCARLAEDLAGAGIDADVLEAMVRDELRRAYRTRGPGGPRGGGR
jgi:GntR family transcriptional regulator